MPEGIYFAEEKGKERGFFLFDIESERRTKKTPDQMGTYFKGLLDHQFQSFYRINCY